MELQVFLVLFFVALVLTSAISAEEKKAVETKNRRKREMTDLGYGTAQDSGIISSFGRHGSLSNVRLPPTVIKKIIRVAVPIPVPVEKKVPVPVPVKVPYAVHKPYPVHISKPYPVPIKKPVPYPVEKPVPYPVKVPVKVPVVRNIAVPMSKHFLYSVRKRMPYRVKVPYVYKKKVPVVVYENQHDEGFRGYDFDEDYENFSEFGDHADLSDDFSFHH